VSSAQHTAFTRRTTRLLALWLLALVLPLQGTAAAVFAAMGPAHGHRVASVAAPVLEDFRRWKPAAQREQHVFAALGHFHALDTPQRHHHARSDASVVAVATDVSDAGEATGASAVAVLAPIPGVVTWLPPALASVDASGPLWPALTGFVLPLDRPPRQQG